jgi:hypothetical protein
MGRSIRNVQRLKLVFEPYHMMFKEVKGKKKQLSSQGFYREMKKAEKYQNVIFLGEGQCGWCGTKSPREVSDEWGSVFRTSYFIDIKILRIVRNLEKMLL